MFVLAAADKAVEVVPLKTQRGGQFYVSKHEGSADGIELDEHARFVKIQRSSWVDCRENVGQDQKGQSRLYGSCAAVSEGKIERILKLQAAIANRSYRVSAAVLADKLIKKWAVRPRKT